MVKALGGSLTRDEVKGAHSEYCEADSKSDI